VKLKPLIALALIGLPCLIAVVLVGIVLTGGLGDGSVVAILVALALVTFAVTFSARKLLEDPARRHLGVARLLLLLPFVAMMLVSATTGAFRSQSGGLWFASAMVYFPIAVSLEVTFGLAMRTGQRLPGAVGMIGTLATGAFALAATWWSYFFGYGLYRGYAPQPTWQADPGRLMAYAGVIALSTVISVALLYAVAPRPAPTAATPDPNTPDANAPDPDATESSPRPVNWNPAARAALILPIMALVLAFPSAFYEPSDLWLGTFCVLTLGLCAASLNAARLARVRDAHAWVRWLWIASTLVAAALAISVVLSGARFLESPAGEILTRLLVAASVAWAFSGIALVAADAIARRRPEAANANTASRTWTSAKLVCPRCERAFVASAGACNCPSCNLEFTLAIVEPTCPACDYSLLDLHVDRCPECGLALSATPAPAPAGPAAAGPAPAAG
jgi:hypothetical protein